jgi:hypothetical protein
MLAEILKVFEQCRAGSAFAGYSGHYCVADGAA